MTTPGQINARSSVPSRTLSPRYPGVFVGPLPDEFIRDLHPSQLDCEPEACTSSIAAGEDPGCEARCCARFVRDTVVCGGIIQTAMNSDRLRTKFCHGRACPGHPSARESERAQGALAEQQILVRDRGAMGGRHEGPPMTVCWGGAGLENLLKSDEMYDGGRPMRGDGTTQSRSELPS
jgi:hypothetical protein